MFVLPASGFVGFYFPIGILQRNGINITACTCDDLNVLILKNLYGTGAHASGYDDIYPDVI